MLGRLALALISIGLPALASSQELKPAILFDFGDAAVRSANDSARRGSNRFRSEAGVAIDVAEPQADGQREDALRRFASGGFWPIIAVGAAQAGAVDKIAKQFPNVRFTLIDGVVDLPNVQSVTFKEHEAAFMAGAVAAKASRSGKVGFVGGMDNVLTRRHACGFAQGIKSVNPKTELLQAMVGATTEAWNDPIKGTELARDQIDRGADVIYQAARATGLGVLRAAADAGKLAIGSDVNQNALYPGSVLTSAIKRFDTATESTLRSATDGSWKPGSIVLGVKERGVGLAIDDNNRASMSADVKAAAERAEQDITAGLVQVHDYATNQQCVM
jgi:basic membrane protein A and related proteins